jgi:hypothetical protein
VCDLCPFDGACVSFAASSTAINSPGTTLLSVATNVDEGQLTFTYEQTDSAARRAGVTIVPSGAVATVNAAAGVPRGVLHFAVTVHDPSGATAGAALSVSVNNHAPVANAGDDRSHLPAENIAILGSASDVDRTSPDRPDTIASKQWTVLNPVTGVSLLNATTFTPTFVVNRAMYQGGPAARAFTLRLVVTDDQGATGTDEARVTVLDERGPFVDVDSPFAGTGPAGFCGHIRHPCNNLPDAVHNVSAAIADGVALERNVHVATRVDAATGLPRPYLHESSLLLNSGIGARCGFDPSTLDDNGDWEQSAPHSPLRFRSAIGVRIANDGSAARVLLQRCDVENIDGAVGLERVGVSGEAADADLDDGRIVGAGAGADPGTAVGVSITTATRAAPTALHGNTIIGALSITGGSGAPTTAIGVRVLTEATLSENTILGGDATAAATGIFADGTGSAFAFSSTDDVIDGALLADTLRGVHLTSGGSATLLRSTVRARVPSAAALPVHAWGIHLENGAGLTMTDGGVDAGSASESAIGIRHASAGRLRVLRGAAGAAVVAGAGGAGVSGASTGIALTCPSAAAAAAPHEIIGATVLSGTALNTSGLSVSGCGNIELRRSSLGAAAAVDRSVGVESLSTRLVAEDVIAEAGSGDSASLGINVVGAQVLLQNVDASAAFASGASGAVASSIGVRLENLPTGAASSVAVTLVGCCALSGGAAGPAAESESAGLQVVGLAQGLELVGLTLTGGDAARSSAGLTFEAVNGALVKDSVITGGTAPLSFGVRVVGAADDLDLVDNAIVGGDSSSALASDGSTGLRFEDVCRGCFVLHNDIAAGAAPFIAGFSVGMRTVGKGAADAVTYVASNAIRAGAANESAAVLAEGYSSDDPSDFTSRIRYLHNVLDAGGRIGGALGAAVVLRLQETLPPAGANHPAAFAGNILVPGLSGARIGFVEECRAGVLGTASHSRVARAENTSFHSAGSATFSALVREVEPAGAACGANNDETSIVDVNAGAGGLLPYRQVSAADTSYERDSQFAADQLHLLAGAFLRDKGVATPRYWSEALLGAMGDIDGESRPLGAAYDIGADELN